MNTETFVRRMLDLGNRRGDIPIYGSPEWEDLPTDDPRRFAAVVRSAECWRRDGSPEAIRRRLRAELHAERWIAHQMVRDADQDLIDALRDFDWREFARRMGLPQTPEQWIAHYERNAERLAAEMAQRRSQRQQAGRQQAEQQRHREAAA